MHFIYWKTETLRPLLPAFVGGQFRLAKLSPAEDPKKKVIIMFHGGVTSIKIPDMKIKRVVVTFEWLCERHFNFDENDTLEPRWSLIPPPRSGIQRLDVDFVTFYPQPRRNDRLKLKGRGREFCRFYRKDDSANLVKHGDEICAPSPIA